MPGPIPNRWALTAECWLRAKMVGSSCFAVSGFTAGTLDSRTPNHPVSGGADQRIELVSAGGLEGREGAGDHEPTGVTIRRKKHWRGQKTSSSHS